jgi:hypothetical protein
MQQPGVISAQPAGAEAQAGVPQESPGETLAPGDPATREAGTSSGTQQ